MTKIEVIGVVDAKDMEGDEVYFRVDFDGDNVADVYFKNKHIFSTDLDNLKQLCRKIIKMK